MLLPYSASNARRSTFWALLMVAVVAMGVCIPLGLLPSHDVPFSPFWLLGSSVVALTLLCVWGTVYVREEPGLVRILLIGGALFFLLLTVAVLWAAIAAPSIVDTKQMRVKADIQSTRTMLLSYKGTNGYYPSTDQGLEALVRRLMEEVPKDAWGTPTFTAIRENATNSFPPGLIA